MSLLVSSIVESVLSEVDPRRRTWDDEDVLAFVNAGMRTLANEKAFARRDVLVGVSAKSFYVPLAPMKQVAAVWWNRIRLAPFEYGDEVDQELTGDPKYYRATTTGVRLIPAPGSGGTALSFGTSPSVSESDGLAALGDRMWSALNGTTVVHFQPGDGICTNAESATGNVWIEHYYHPAPLELDHLIHERFELALWNWGLYHSLRTARDPADQARRADAYRLFNDEKLRIIAESQETFMTEEGSIRVDILSNYRGRYGKTSIYRS